jgi:hypothetical protein
MSYLNARVHIRGVSVPLQQHNIAIPDVYNQCDFSRSGVVSAILPSSDPKFVLVDNTGMRLLE